MTASKIDTFFSSTARWFTSTGRWATVGLGIAIPLSTALDNLLLVLLLSVLVSNGRAVWQTVTHNPVARASVLLFGALLLGMAYGITPLRQAAGILGKYIDLAFVPLLMVVARDAVTRRRAMTGFVAVMLITALLSWLVGLGILPVAKWMWHGCLPENPAIFRSSITQNILMVYAAYLLALHACETSAPAIKWWTAALAIFAGSNVLFMVSGKIGYLLLLVLLIYFFWRFLARRLRNRGQKISWYASTALGFLALMLVLGSYQTSPRLHARMDEMVRDMQTWQPNMRNETSTGERLDFYYNTFSLVQQSPLVGLGTGGFPAAYAQQVQHTDVRPTRNPHNEYLMIMVQLGVAGLGLLLYLFYTQWRSATQLRGLFEQEAARGLVLTIAITALFNSPLLDHTEGLFFAFMSAMLFANIAPDKRNE